MTGEHRAVVVGGGLGGLTAACLLASRGVETTLVEKTEQIGGCAGGLAVDGFRFDLGATMLQTPKVLGEIFGLLGESPDDHLELLPLDPIYRLTFSDGESLELGRSVDATAEAVGRLSPADRDGFLRYMGETEALKRDLKRLFVDGGLSRKLDFLSPAGLHVFRHLNPLLSVRGRIRRLFRDPRLRDAFSFQVLYFGAPPAVCPSVYSMVPYFEIQQGVWYPKGGISALPAALARIFTDLGGRLLTSAPVRQVTAAHGRASGVLLETGEHLPARVVISNADALYTYRHLMPPGHRPSWSQRRRLDRLHLSCSSLLLLLGLRGRRPDLSHHGFYLPGSSERGYRAIFDEGRLPEQAAAYVCCPSRSDPGMAPEGHESLYILAPAPRRLAAGSWQERGEELADELLDKLEARGLSGLRRQIVSRTVLTPHTYESRFNLPEGMTFGLQPRLRQMGPFRPGVRSPLLPGLFLAGASVHPGSGIPLVMASGRKAAEAALGDLGLPLPCDG